MPVDRFGDFLALDRPLQLSRIATMKRVLLGAGTNGLPLEIGIEASPDYDELFIRTPSADYLEKHGLLVRSPVKIPPFGNVPYLFAMRFDPKILDELSRLVVSVKGPDVSRIGYPDAKALRKGRVVIDRFAHSSQGRQGRFEPLVDYFDDTLKQCSLTFSLPQPEAKTG